MFKPQTLSTASRLSPPLPDEGKCTSPVEKNTTSFSAPCPPFSTRSSSVSTVATSRMNIPPSSIAMNGHRPPVGGLFPSKFNVTESRFATSADPRGYIPIYEYSFDSHSILMDSENSMIHFTGIYKALGHKKTDVKLLETEPRIASVVKKIKGGSLKIQGTWLPYTIAMEISKRVAWKIRYELIPIYGPDFPETCQAPGTPGYGNLTSPDYRPTPVTPSIISTTSLAASRPRRSWKWKNNGQVETTTLSSRGGVNSTESKPAKISSYHFPSRSPTSIRFTPYPTPPPSASLVALTPSRPSPHVYTFLTNEQAVPSHTLPSPYSRYLSQDNYSQPSSRSTTPISRSAAAGLMSMSNETHFLTSTYSFPARSSHSDDHTEFNCERFDTGEGTTGQSEKGIRSLPSIDSKLQENSHLDYSGESECVGAERRSSLPLGLWENKVIDVEGKNGGGVKTTAHFSNLSPIPSPARLSLSPRLSSPTPFDRSSIRDTHDLAQRILSQRPFDETVRSTSITTPEIVIRHPIPVHYHHHHHLSNESSTYSQSISQLYY